MFDDLRKANQQLNIKSIYDSCFITYGKVIEEDVSDVLNYVSASVQPPKNENSYIPSVKAIEQLSSIQRISHQIYGYMDVMAGIVYGHNQVLNGIEYHQGSETIIAATDYVLIVGHIWDMKTNTYDSSLCECFYVQKGTIVECYSTTLHYTPCCVHQSGFITICLLPRGTGEDLKDGRLGILKKKNKWFIAHIENEEKIKSGDYPGLLGTMIKIEIE